MRSARAAPALPSNGSQARGGDSCVPGATGLGWQTPGHCSSPKEAPAAWECQGRILRGVSHVVISRHGDRALPVPVQSGPAPPRTSPMLLLFWPQPLPHPLLSLPSLLPAPSWSRPHCDQLATPRLFPQAVEAPGSSGTRWVCPRHTVETPRIFLLWALLRWVLAQLPTCRHLLPAAPHLLS